MISACGKMVTMMMFTEVVMTVDLVEVQCPKNVVRKEEKKLIYLDNVINEI